MNEDTINRKAAIDVIASMEAVAHSPYVTIGRLDALLALNRLPSAEQQGKWVNEKYRWIKSISMWWSAAYECSVCGEAGIKDWHYCPMCGASMMDDNAIQHTKCVGNALDALDEVEE